MKYTVDKRDKFTILSIEEENLNSVVAPTLKSDLVIMKNEGVQYLVVDLSKVSYIDSSGLSAILVGDRLWKGEGAFILTGSEPAGCQEAPGDLQTGFHPGNDTHRGRSQGVRVHAGVGKRDFNGRRITKGIRWGIFWSLYWVAIRQFLLGGGIPLHSCWNARKPQF
jgi:anti-anti-sigma factor